MRFLTVQFLIILFSMCSIQAQVVFTSSSKEDMTTISDTLISNIKEDYKYKKEHTYNEYTYSIIYENAQNQTIEIFFNVRYKNQDIDLKIEGAPEYNFSHVKAKFLDLYPFWIRYIKQNEDQEQIISKKSSFIFKDDKHFLFRKQGELWVISMKDKL